MANSICFMFSPPNFAYFIVSQLNTPNEQLKCKNGSLLSLFDISVLQLNAFCITYKDFDALNYINKLNLKKYIKINNFFIFIKIYLFFIIYDIIILFL